MLGTNVQDAVEACVLAIPLDTCVNGKKSFEGLAHVCVCGFRVNREPHLTYATCEKSFQLRILTRKYHNESHDKNRKRINLVPVEYRTWVVWI